MTNMKIRVYAPPFFDHSCIDGSGLMEIAAGSTLADVYKKLGVPLVLRPILFCSVNYEKARSDRKLEDGDIVSIYFPLTGG